MDHEPRHIRPRTRRNWPQRVAIGFGIAGVVACVGLASAISYVYWKTGSFARANVSLDNVSGNQAPRNYLIIGSDSRANIDPSDPNAGVFLGPGGNGEKNSDTILIMRVDPAAGDVKLLSLPRDLWVPIAGTGKEFKINSAYGRGRQVLIDTIRSEFDLTINNYIEVDFKGFQELVDAIGGVNLYFPTPMKDDHTGLDVQSTGCVKLNGEQGLAYARSRYTQYKRPNGTWSDTDPIADLGRIKRQQLFVRRAMRKIASLNITDLLTFNNLLDVATRSVTLDQTIDRGDLRALAQRFKSISDDDIHTYSLPVRGATSPEGLSILYYDRHASQPILNIFRGKDANTVLEPDVTVDVRNGSGGKNQGRDVLAAFTQIGFTAGSVGPDVKPTEPTTTIHYAPGSENAADLVARHVTAPTQLLADPAIAAGRVLVVTGTNFTTLFETPRPPQSTTTTVASTTSPPATATTPATTAPTTTTTTDPYIPGMPPAGVSC